MDELLAYALSFTVIGIVWQTHGTFFRLADRFDRLTVFVNLALETLVSLIAPWSSFARSLLIAGYYLVPRAVDTDVPAG